MTTLLKVERLFANKNQSDKKNWKDPALVGVFDCAALREVTQFTIETEVGPHTRSRDQRCGN